MASSRGGQLGRAGQHGDGADPGERAEREVAGDPAPVERRSATAVASTAPPISPATTSPGLADEAAHGDGAGDEGDGRQEPGPLLGDVGGAARRRPGASSGAPPPRPAIRLPATPTATRVPVESMRDDGAHDGGEHGDRRAGPVVAEDRQRRRSPSRVRARTGSRAGGGGDGRGDADRGGDGGEHEAARAAAAVGDEPAGAEHEGGEGRLACSVPSEAGARRIGSDGGEGAEAGEPLDDVGDDAGGDAPEVVVAGGVGDQLARAGTRWPGPTRVVGGRRCPGRVHEAMAPTAPRATPSSTRPASWRRRPAMPSTTAAVDAGEHGGQAGLLAGEAEALEGAGAREGEVVDEGEQRSHAGQRRPAGGQAVAAPGQRGARRSRPAPAGRGARWWRRCRRPARPPTPRRPSAAPRSAR